MESDSITFITGNKDTPGDKPLSEIADMIEKEILPRGWHYLQKFSCDKCGNRLTMDVLDILYVEGECDKCCAITDIKKSGCGFMMITDPSMMVKSGLLRYPKEDEVIDIGDS